LVGKQNQAKIKMIENYKSKLHNKRIGFRNYSDNFKIIKSTAKNISIEEQELHINVIRNGFNALICCTDQRYITKLRKNPSFVCEEILISESNSGYILQVRGTLPYNLISLRSISRCSSSQKDINQSSEGCQNE
jgi:hypothetical protein